MSTFLFILYMDYYVTAVLLAPSIYYSMVDIKYLLNKGIFPKCLLGFQLCDKLDNLT